MINMGFACMSVPHLCGPGQVPELLFALTGEVRDWIVVQVERGVETS